MCNFNCAPEVGIVLVNRKSRLPVDHENSWISVRMQRDGRSYNEFSEDLEGSLMDLMNTG